MIELITCPTCERFIHLDSMQSDEISSPIGVEQARDMGYTIGSYAPEAAQLIVNRGECNCGEAQEVPEVDQNQLNLF